MSGVSASTPGVDISAMFENGMDSIGDKGSQLQAEMDALLNQEGGASPEQMMELQFKMGQYNTMVESLSTITKSLTDSMKSIAQRTG